ncbi:hypothetical protein LguiA_035063 [Lonicera macranthoides]
MGCFFGCFRIRDDHRPSAHLVSEPVPPYNLREAAVSRNRSRLSTLLLSEVEETDDSLCKGTETHDPGTPHADIDVRELKDEAKFLKACGTLTETPGEIRKTAEKWKDNTSHDMDSDSENFHSWLPNTSVKKLNLDTQPDQPPTPIKLSEGRAIESSYSANTPSGSTEGSAIGSVNKVTQVDAIQTHKSKTSAISPSAMVVNEQRGNKSVRFDCDSDASSISSKGSSSETVGENWKQLESAGNHRVSKRSPYPTPLKLSDDIQTPGTAFPAYLENMENGRNPRIRSQYVYPIQNPVEDISQWNVVKEKDSENIRESLEQDGKVPSKLEKGKRENSGEEVLKVEESLSSWLKPRPSNEKGNSHSGLGENAGFGKSHEDRPILGMVAAHWNEAEPTHVSPKWWDGNGIPNSTTKYKEDQKVSWHATPFEERLEKALSEETFISQRKNISGTPPVNFDESEECDTALSQLQSSMCHELQNFLSCNNLLKSEAEFGILIL